MTPEGFIGSLAAIILSILGVAGWFFRRSMITRAEFNEQKSAIEIDRQKREEETKAANEKFVRDVATALTARVDTLATDLTRVQSEKSGLEKQVNALTIERDKANDRSAERDRLIGEATSKAEAATAQATASALTVRRLERDLDIKSSNQQTVQERADQIAKERDELKVINATLQGKITECEHRIAELEKWQSESHNQRELWQNAEMERKSELMLAKHELTLYRNALEKANRVMVEFGLTPIEVLVDPIAAAGQVAKERIHEESEKRRDLVESIKRATAGEGEYYAIGAATPPSGVIPPFTDFIQTAERPPSTIASEIIDKAERRAELNTPAEKLDPEGKQL